MFTLCSYCDAAGDPVRSMSNLMFSTALMAAARDLASILTASACHHPAGLCLMQLAVPRLRSGSNLQKFNAALKAAGHDLAAWRVRANLPAKESAILDADDAAGWQLAEALLRPRKIETDEEAGTVKFVTANGQAARLGVSQALGHRFMQQVGHALAQDCCHCKQIFHCFGTSTCHDTTNAFRPIHNYMLDWSRCQKASAAFLNILINSDVSSPRTKQMLGACC